MPHKIINAKTLAPQVRLLEVHAPHVTRHCQPGQFIILRVVSSGERIPLTVAKSDRAAGTLTLIVQAVGATSRLLTSLNAGDFVSDIAGPMGLPTHLEKVKHAVIVGGGVGTAVILPQAIGLRALGNHISAIIGGRSKDYVILEPELRQLCDNVYPCTDDGSYGFKGFVTQKLKEIIETSAKTDKPVELVICAGPVPMMRALAETTRPYGIKTMASLNPIMVDGTGMCGGCRVQVDGKTYFACVDGPEFDAHKVDFTELADRLTAYKIQEKVASDRHLCKIGL